MTAARLPTPLPSDESDRQAAFDAMMLGDSPDPVLDRITALAALLCQMPMSLVTLLDGPDARFPSSHGLETAPGKREDSFCAHAIMEPDSVMVVPDAKRDPVLHAYPAVAGDLQLRSYAGVPLLSPGGQALGALCVFDNQPRTLTDTQVQYLRLLGRMAQLRLAEGAALAGS